MNAAPPNPDDSGSRRGRPTRLTDALFREFLRLFLAGGFRETTCRQLGVGYTTFQRWMRQGRKHPDGIYGEFRRGVLAAEARSQNRLLDRVQAAALEDWKAAAWVLERKHPKQFGQHRGELGDLKRQIRELEKIVEAAAAQAPGAT